MRSASGTAGAGEEQLSMSAAELNEFLTAMEIVRLANAALLDTACDALDADDDQDQSRAFAGLPISPTIH
jgi:hypothetical protein